jgi:small GTP-binding protein
MSTEGPQVQDRLKAKVCLVGDQGVGKTSLIRRFVLNEYDDRYISTVGTKVSKKQMWITFPERTDAIEVDLQVWDIMGEPFFRGALRDAYFAGAQGVLAVCDLTRPETLDGVLAWVDLADPVAKDAAWYVVANKADLKGDARIGDAEFRRITDVLHCDYLPTSAKTGENVPEAFAALTKGIVANLLRSGSPSFA